MCGLQSLAASPPGYCNLSVPLVLDTEMQLSINATKYMPLKSLTSSNILAQCTYTPTWDLEALPAPHSLSRNK